MKLQKLLQRVAKVNAKMELSINLEERMQGHQENDESKMQTTCWGN